MHTPHPIAARIRATVRALAACAVIAVALIAVGLLERGDPAGIPVGIIAAILLAAIAGALHLRRGL